MARTSPVFICSACGGETLKWQGQCPGCGEWNSLGQRSVPRQKATTSPFPAAVPRPLDSTLVTGLERLASGQDELDRVFGAGIVPGSVTLLGGDPGIGKSTLLLQVAAHVAAAHGVLYASGEESVAQIGMRAQRLGLSAAALGCVAETDLQSILALASERKAALLVVDSIQTV
ncbi:MAG: radA, partial [Gammaproteobacteria bacterium]|nr:radA [Gammaproteobacteria bacterium]